MKPVSTNTPLGWLTTLTLLALGLRLVLIPTRLLLEDDGPYYVALAAQLLRGEWSGALNDYWSQFYPVLIALVGVFTRDVELAARLASALCGALLVPAVWWLTSEIAEPLSARLAALFTVFQPWLLVFSALALTEMAFTLFMVAAFTLMLRAGRLGGSARFAWAGGLTGLAILTRSEGLVLVVGLVGVGVMRLARHRHWRAAGENLFAFAALVVVMAPQSIGTYQIYGHFNWAWKSSINVALGDTFNDPSQAEQAVYRLDEQGQRQLNVRARETSLGEYWLKHPAEMFRRVGENMRVVWRDQMMAVWLPLPQLALVLTWGMGLVAALGAVIGLFGAKRGAWLGTLSFVGAYGLGLLSVLVHRRLLIPLTPFVLIFMAVGCLGLARAGQWLAGRFMSSNQKQVGSRGVVIISAVVIVWAAAAGYGWADMQRAPLGATPVAQKEAGVWLRAHAPQAAKVLSHNPQTPFYFYETWPFDRAMSLPWAAPDEVLAYARQQQVRYIVLEEWLIRSAHFPVEPWLDNTRSHPGLTLLKIFGTAPYRVMIYQRTD